MDERHQLAYEEALRAVADQQSALDALRSRAGVVASAGAIAIGSLALGRPPAGLVRQA